MDDLDPYSELKSDFKQTKGPLVARIQGTHRPEAVETRAGVQYIDPLHATLHELQWFVANFLERQLLKVYPETAKGVAEFLQATGHV